MSKLATVIKKFPKVFWVSNIVELFERWAWYGFYNSFALYLTLSKESGALGFSQVEKGAIIGTGTMLLYILPIITGAIADRIGFKKVLLISFAAYIAGYFMVGHFDTYPMVFAAYLFLAFAGAMFKPVISGTVAKSTTYETASVGFGIFYMMVNVGGFIGPFIAGFLYKTSWDYVFYMSMGTIAINYIFILFLYKEPGRESTGKKFLENIIIAFKNIGSTLTDWRYDIFLLIMGIYWAAFNQLFYSLPVFLEAWIDLDRIGAVFHLAPGTITAVTITSLDSFFIIILQMYISSVSQRIKPLTSIMTGTTILSLGLLLMFTTFSPWIVIFGILVFGIGEMASSPKCQEYIGRIAPADKKALYMGTYFLPVGIGHLAAGWISGKPYEVIADKYYLLQKAVAEKGFDIQPVSDTFTQTQYFEKAQQLFGMDSHQLTSYLWNTYHPSHVWVIFTGLAICAAVLLFLYDRYILISKSETVNDSI
jgi:proton-dependent oligopeptide transporter, POT family